MAAIPPQHDQAAAECVHALVGVAARLAAAGWVPATSGNFSMRVDATRIAITRSGADKGQLTPDGILLIDMHGKVVSGDGHPSAETRLHTQIYAHLPDARVVLHTHSRTQSVASRLYAADGCIRMHGWELQKAIPGRTTHADTLEIPVIANSQDMAELAARIEPRFASDPSLFAYLIAGHGLYAWGRNVAEAERVAQAVDFLLGCELELRRFGHEPLAHIQ